MADGRDVLFFPCNRSLVDSFKLFDAGIVFMSWVHQWPDMERKMGYFPAAKQITPEEFPNPMAEFLFTERKFMNSGVSIGYAGM